MISGVKISPRKQIIDERGKIMHMLRNDDEIFKKFGEIYFSCSFPGTIKAWHIHKKMTLNYSVICGKIKLVLYDDRKDSKTKGEVQEIYLSTENYSIITVPPLIWNGFKAVGNETCIVANCSDIPHEKNEIKRKPFDDANIPYNWGIKHK
jgi:dTDP-4-dehydrorhamnose 3,5-epimerase|tara:strand:+ start:113 stop:562 length:450 start_codon:yes stop_codon:yes gene_type:complete